jgi:FkbM family methyltransferase
VKNELTEFDIPDKGLKPLSELHNVLLFDANRLRFYNQSAFDTIIDIGSNTGSFISYARTMHPRADIIAYEPFPSSYASSVHIKRLYTDPPILAKYTEFGTIKVYNKGLGDGIPFYFNQKGRNQIKNPINKDFQLTPIDGVFKPIDSDYNPDTDFTVETVTLKNIVAENNLDLKSNIYLKVDCECSESSLYNQESLDIMLNFRAVFLEIHFPPHNEQQEYIKPDHQFNQCPNCLDYREHDEWIRSNFTDTHDIDYFMSGKGLGHGHYLLTKKEDNVPSYFEHFDNLKQS